MELEALPLFSHSGASTNSTQFHPTLWFDETQSTITLMRDLFGLLETATGCTSLIDIDKVPKLFQAELRALFCGNAHSFFSLSDLRNGINNMCRRFLSRDAEVQKRGNAFVRVQMSLAEMILYGECRCADAAAVERDQQIIFENNGDDDGNGNNSSFVNSAHSFNPNPVSAPTATRSSSHSHTTPPTTPSRTSSQQQPEGQGQQPHPPRGMFRSDSLGEGPMFPKSLLTLDEASNAMLDKFMENEFTSSSSLRPHLNPRTLSESTKMQLEELWEYFAVSRNDDILTKDDLANGFTKWGSNFIASDSTCQVLGNYYVQRKLRQAIAVFYSALYHQQDSNAPPQTQVLAQTQSSVQQATDTPGINDNASEITSSSVPPSRSVSATDEMREGTHVLIFDEPSATSDAPNPSQTPVLGVIRGPVFTTTQNTRLYEVDVCGTIRYVPVTSLRVIDDLVLLSSPPVMLAEDNEEDGGDTNLQQQPQQQQTGGHTLALNVPRERGTSSGITGAPGRVRADSGYGTMDSPAAHLNAHGNSSRSRSGSVNSPSALLRRQGLGSRSNSQSQQQQQQQQQQQPGIPSYSEYIQQSSAIISSKLTTSSGNTAAAANPHGGSVHEDMDTDDRVTEASRLLSQLANKEATDFVNQFKVNPSNNNAATFPDVGARPGQQPQRPSGSHRHRSPRSYLYRDEHDVDDDDIEAADADGEDDANSVDCLADDTDTRTSFSNFPTDTTTRQVITSGDYINEDIDDDELIKFLLQQGFLGDVPAPSDATTATNTQSDAQQDQENVDPHSQQQGHPPRAYDVEDIRNLQHRQVSDGGRHIVSYDHNDHHPHHSHHSHRLEDQVDTHIRIKPKATSQSLFPTNPHSHADIIDVADIDFDSLQTETQRLLNNKRQQDNSLPGAPPNTQTRNSPTNAWNRDTDDDDETDDEWKGTTNKKGRSSRVAPQPPAYPPPNQPNARGRTQVARAYPIPPFVNPDLVSGVSMTASERQVLQELVQRLGNGFVLSDTVMEEIEPVFQQKNYFLWFRVCGRRTQYNFCQQDYGISFRPFLQEECAGDLILTARTLDEIYTANYIAELEKAHEQEQIALLQVQAAQAVEELEEGEVKEQQSEGAPPTTDGSSIDISDVNENDVEGVMTPPTTHSSEYVNVSPPPPPSADVADALNDTQSSDFDTTSPTPTPDVPPPPPPEPTPLQRAEQLYIINRRLLHAINETNRCFYLHLGVGLKIHPFALQALFRIAAADLLSRPDDEKCILFSECLRAEAEYVTSEPGLLNRSGLFTDAMALCAIWPVEMDEYRLVVCQLHSNDTLLYYTVFEPEHGPHNEEGTWTGKDIVMTNQNGHFTYLGPHNNHPLVNATLLIAHAAQAAEENPNMANVMTYAVTVNPQRRYSLADVLAWMGEDFDKLSQDQAAQLQELKQQALAKELKEKEEAEKLKKQREEEQQRQKQEQEQAQSQSQQPAPLIEPHTPQTPPPRRGDSGFNGDQEGGEEEDFSTPSFADIHSKLKQQQQQQQLQQTASSSNSSSRKDKSSYALV